MPVRTYLGMYVSLRRLGAVTLQVIDPRAGLAVALGSLARDDQLAKPRPRRVSWRSFKRHQDVLALLGEDAVDTFDGKAGVVHLGTV